MAAQAITRATNGTLQVPARPTIPVLDGDGVGPELWRACRPVLDQAIQKAYAGKKAIDWLLLPAGAAARESTGHALPATTLAALAQHPVALKGPLQSAAGEPSLEDALRRKLDLYAGLVQVPVASGAPVAVFLDLSEGAHAEWEFPPLQPQTQALLDVLRKHAPDQFLRIRFGSRERTDSYLRAQGKRETPVVEVALSLEPRTRVGTHRLALAAYRWATEQRRKTVTLVHQAAALPQTEGGWVDWAYDMGDEVLSLIEPDYLRAVSRAGKAVAEQGKAGVQQAGGIYVHELELGDALAQVVSGTSAFDVALTSGRSGLYLARALAAPTGGAATLACRSFNPESGHALFGPLHGAASALAGQDRANPIALLRAGAELLAHVGWGEASALVSRAVDTLVSQGVLTADMPRASAPAALSAWTAAAARTLA